MIYDQESGLQGEFVLGVPSELTGQLLLGVAIMCGHQYAEWAFRNDGSRTW